MYGRDTETGQSIIPKFYDPINICIGSTEHRLRHINNVSHFSCKFANILLVFNALSRPVSAAQLQVRTYDHTSFATRLANATTETVKTAQLTCPMRAKKHM